MSKLQDVKPRAIKLTLDKERTLMFDLNAFAELEEKYGSVDDALAAIDKGSMKAIRTMLWAGLVHEDETLTERQVGAMLSVSMLENMTAQLLAALEVARPEAEEVVEQKLGNQ
jgi:hypothetical protein